MGLPKRLAEPYSSTNKDDAVKTTPSMVATRTLTISHTVATSYPHDYCKQNKMK